MLLPRWGLGAARLLLGLEGARLLLGLEGARLTASGCPMLTLELKEKELKCQLHLSSRRPILTSGSEYTSKPSSRWSRATRSKKADAELVGDHVPLF